MDNQQLTANIVVLTTAISALLTFFGPGEKKAFIDTFEERIKMIREHSLAKTVTDELIGLIESESTAFLRSII